MTRRHGQPGPSDAPRGGSARGRLVGVVAILAALTAVAAVAARGVGLGAGGDRAWLGHVRWDGSTWWALGVAAGSCAAMAWLVGALWRLGAAHRRATRDAQGGTAIIEFALVLPILLTISLVMLQSSLLVGGNLCVGYASFCAARSAIVQAPADYGDVSGEGPNVMREGIASLKRDRIHRAAVWAVMPVSYGGERFSEDPPVDLAERLTRISVDTGSPVPGWLDDRLGRKWSYAREFTTVDVSPPAEPPAYGEHEDLVVTVEHVYYLSVPYANRLLARLDSDGTQIDAGDGGWGMRIRATCRLPNEGPQDYVDVETFDE